MDDNEMHLLVLEYLQGLTATNSYNNEKISQALNILKDALYVDANSGDDFEHVSYFPLTLADFVNVGKDKLKLTHPAALLQEVEGDAEYTAFEDVLSGKGYFNGVEEGSVAYKQRKVKSISKYLERKVSRLSPEDVAEEKKTLGNNALLAKDYDEAIIQYSAALALSDTGPNSHVYYANRAAAFCYKKKYEDAVADCEASLMLNPDYGKAHTRLATSYYYLNKYQDAYDAVQKALRYEPESKANKELMQNVSAKLGYSGGSSSGAGGRGMDVGGLDPSVLGGLASNPMFTNALSQMGGMDGINNMMKDPATQQMMQNMMKDPNMMKQAMSMLGGMKK